MLDIYKKLERGSAGAYTMMALLNIGSFAASFKLAQGFYGLVHGAQGLAPKEGTDYYVSPIAEYLYDHNMTLSQRQIQSRGAPSITELRQILDQAPAYSEAFYNLMLSTYAAKTTYSAIARSNQPEASKNPLSVFAYATTQPMAVVLQDSGKLR